MYNNANNCDVCLYFKHTSSYTLLLPVHYLIALAVVRLNQRTAAAVQMAAYSSCSSVGKETTMKKSVVTNLAFKLRFLFTSLQVMSETINL